MMAAVAVALGGGVAAGGLVATLQAVGAVSLAELGAGAICAVAAVGVVVGVVVVAVGVAVMSCMEKRKKN
jgi:hypothetical protein